MLHVKLLLTRYLLCIWFLFLVISLIEFFSYKFFEFIVSSITACHKSTWASTWRLLAHDCIVTINRLIVIKQLCFVSCCYSIFNLRNDHYLTWKGCAIVTKLWSVCLRSFFFSWNWNIRETTSSITMMWSKLSTNYIFNDGWLILILIIRNVLIWLKICNVISVISIFNNSTTVLF